MLFFNFPDGEASWTHIYSDVWRQVRVLSNITQLSCITSKATKHRSQGLPQDKREYQRYQTREMHLECLFDWGLKTNPCSKISLVLCFNFFSSWLYLPNSTVITWVCSLIVKAIYKTCHPSPFLFLDVTCETTECWGQ